MKYFFSAIIVLIVGVMLVPHNTQAARLHFRMEKTTYKTGESGFATLNVDTETKTVNAVEATIGFNPELVDVTKISIDKSIINFWVQSTRVDAKAGLITLKGIILNPGYKGNPGRIIGFDFKAKAPGTFPFNVSKMTVLANDGKATALKTTVEARPITVSGPATAKNAVSVSSTTHPKQTSWYSKNSASIVWTVADKTVTGVAYVFDKNAKTDPSNAALTTFKSAVQRNLTSGVWYAHVRAKNTKGWLATQHYKIQIDLERPSANTVTVLPRLSEAVLPTIRASAKDELSGIATYEIIVNGKLLTSAKTVSGLKLSKLKIGKNTVEVKAIDNAGNIRSTSITVLYNPLPGTKATPTTPKATPTPTPTTPKIKAPVQFD